MTHSGGKPHAVGDHGQRYEVTYFEPRENKRKVFGWADTPEAAARMASAIEKHPAWEYPQVRDRQAPELAGTSGVSICGATCRH